MRVFAAAIPPRHVLDVIEASVARPAIDGVRWTTREQWHVTLRFLGTVGDSELDALVVSLDALLGRGAVDVTLGPATACFGRSLLNCAGLWIDVTGRRYGGRHGRVRFATTRGPAVLRAHHPRPLLSPGSGPPQ